MIPSRSISNFGANSIVAALLQRWRTGMKIPAASSLEINRAVSFKLKLCVGFILGIRLCEMAEYSLYAHIFERRYFPDLFDALVGIGVAYAPHSGFKRNVERRDLPRRAVRSDRKPLHPTYGKLRDVYRT